ncbi:MAG: hypothetical protein HYY38_09790, partial [Rhodospirillales bacterium]|nr:hypothetical protein [Rhodospirillales bacterium]
MLDERRRGLPMRQIDGDHVADDDGGDHRVPGELGADDGDIDPVAGAAEHVPAGPERIGGERDYVLALDQEEGQVMRQMIGDGDRYQRRREPPRRFHGAESVVDQRHHQPAGDKIGGQEQQPETNQPKRPADHLPALTGGGNGGQHHIFQLPEARGNHQPVVEHHRQEQQHQRHHRGRNGVVAQQPDGKGAQRPLPLGVVGKAIAGRAVDADTVVVQATEPTAGANLRPGDACLKRREARQHGEQHAEHLAMLEPPLAAECHHARPGDCRVADQHPGDVGGLGRLREHQLSPRERREQHHRRPCLPTSGIGQAEAEVA